MALPQLTPNQIEQIAKILGGAFTGSEIGHGLAQCRIPDPDPGMTKWKRIYNAFSAAINNSNGSTNVVYVFLRHCLEPARVLQDSERFDAARLEINKILMLTGTEIRDDGKFYPVAPAESVSEIQRRTRDLRMKMIGSHSRVLACCREELLADDYFHAVHEAAKSLCDHVREMTGLITDGANLFNTAFSSNNPYLLYGNVLTETGRNQQNGLKEMLCGVFHMVRNVTAHELRTRWDINENDAVAILTEISYLHNLLDQCDVVRTE